MHSSDQKAEKAKLAAQDQMNFKWVSHCIPGILSKCGAGKAWAKQRLCGFAVKSDYANKCVYYNASMDGHCDSIDAQEDARKIFEIV